jgi:hypothetical protein
MEMCGASAQRIQMDAKEMTIRAQPNTPQITIGEAFMRLLITMYAASSDTPVHDE